MANKVQIEVEARFQDNVTGKTKSADESIKKLGKPPTRHRKSWMTSEKTPARS